ncbi:hypothetical protein F5Y10DRAFT_273161 [Nemania abortiva]|nr:hypothetical protein F5Y10DRAFT_273161 [Nemania abortiva]
MKSDNIADVSTAVFIQGFGALIKSMLEKDFKVRPSAEASLLDMKELEAQLAVLKLDLPRIHICLDLAGQTFQKVIKPAQFRPSRRIIHEHVADFRSQRRKIIPSWLGSTTTIVDLTMFRRQRPSGGGVNTIRWSEKYSQISPRPEEHASDWAGSVRFYQDLHTFSKNTINKDNIPWELALRIHETRLEITSWAFIGLIIFGAANAVLFNWLATRVAREQPLSGAAIWLLFLVVVLLRVPFGGLKPGRALRKRLGYKRYVVVRTK